MHEFVLPVHDFDIDNANLLCHSDGGTRAASCSAAGWYLEAVVERENRCYTFPLAMAGEHLHEPISSFTAELIGLEDAVSYVHMLVSKRRDGRTNMPAQYESVAAHATASTCAGCGLELFECNCVDSDVPMGDSEPSSDSDD